MPRPKAKHKMNFKKIALANLLAGFVCFYLSAAFGFAEDDPIYDKCMSQSDRPAPWCYQEEVEEIGDPYLCENILKYRPTAMSVHGWHYYRLAVTQKNCELCNAIKRGDIKRTCK